MGKKDGTQNVTCRCRIELFKRLEVPVLKDSGMSPCRHAFTYVQPSKFVHADTDDGVWMTKPVAECLQTGHKCVLDLPPLPNKRVNGSLVIQQYVQRSVQFYTTTIFQWLHVRKPTLYATNLLSTYNMDAQIGESSACATALLCGVKANYETVGLDSSARFENCNSSFDARVPSLINWAQEQGKSTGLVTTTRVTHATPAALYAHTASRYWEDDGKVPSGARTSCKDIARQLLEDEPGRNINVILGGGRRHFVPKVIQDPEEPDKEGRRLDGRNLIDEWSRNLRLRNVAAKYVANKEQLENVDPRKVNHLLGLFSYSHMDFDVDRNTNGSGDPSLAEMTIKALRILAKNPEGYFLFVEGGDIFDSPGGGIVLEINSEGVLFRTVPQRFVSR
ncbi:Intestinal-type alkaline phosphatase 1 [Eufriesea mexicana]|nr:Intestinal-type alkaline phosphatase 1 [Eufriesea mexicana]